MKLLRGRIFYGWFVLLGCVLVTFGISGSNHSFGVFLKPMTEEFGWSRASLSLAFGITYMISGLLRPLAGYLADRYSPKAACLSGVMVMGLMLFLIPFIENLSQLYVLFAIMSIGVTLGSGPILTKVVSAWFQTRRGLMFSIVSGSGSFGAMILVPATSLFLVLFNWKEAYWFLSLLLLFLILPIGILLIRNRPQEMGLQAFGADGGGTQGALRSDKKVGTMLGRDATFLEALRSPLFAKLTLGYFV
jgi:sugar phosphate permease